MRAPLGTPIGLLTVVAFLLAGPGAHAAGELVLVSDEDLVSIAAHAGTGERVLATERTGPRGGFVYLHGPAWSPDGRWIALASDRNYPVGEHSEIYSIRSDGPASTG
jgi:WD40-like Beta Propeller Repeat